MDKSIVVLSILCTAALVSVVALAIHKNIVKDVIDLENKQSECGAEWIIRSYAYNGRTARELYNNLYGKDPVEGQSALDYCGS